MADQKVSQLAAADALAGDELVPVVQGGVNVQTNAQAIADLASPGGVNVKEVDGNPSAVNVANIVFPNGTLGYDSGTSTVTYTPAGGAATVGTTAERNAATPSAGDIWFDTTLSQTGFYTGSSWLDIVTWAALPVPITDSFTAADGTALVGRTTEQGGKTWAALDTGATATINSNQATFAALHAVGFNTGVTAFTVSFKNVSAVANASFFVRHPGTNTLNGIRLQQVSGTWQWVKDGSVAQNTSIAVSAGQTVSADVSGNVHTVTIGGVSNTYTDAGSSYTSATFVGGSNGLVADDVLVIPA